MRLMSTGSKPQAATVSLNLAAQPRAHRPTKHVVKPVEKVPHRSAEAESYLEPYPTSRRPQSSQTPSKAPPSTEPVPWDVTPSKKLASTLFSAVDSSGARAAADTADPAGSSPEERNEAGELGGNGRRRLPSWRPRRRSPKLLAGRCEVARPRAGPRRVRKSCAHPLPCRAGPSRHPPACCARPRTP